MLASTSGEFLMADADDALNELLEIDALLGADEEDAQHAAFVDCLNSHTEASTDLHANEAQLSELCTQYIAAHIAEADRYGELFHDLRGCEEHLIGFEEDIVLVQRKLAETSEDIVKMQLQTSHVLRGVEHRRQVSHRLNEVYSALQECEHFCTEISTRPVDGTYLANLRELARKFSFLYNNPELHGSAVDLEIRPQLTAAASRAGEKLSQMLAERFTHLLSDMTKMEQGQQALEESAQFAFRFLQVYNRSASITVLRMYVRDVSSAYIHHIRGVLRGLAIASELHAQPQEPIISAEEVFDIICNRDVGAVVGSAVKAPTIHFPARTLARRERSVSQRGQGVELTAGVDALRQQRPPTFADTVITVAALRLRHGKLHVDASCRAVVESSSSWPWRLLCCLQQLVQMCVMECRFIGSFFCVAGDVEGGEDYDSAEAIAQAVLGKSLREVEMHIQADVPLVMEPNSVVAALRVLEMAKQYLCTSIDPIPLLLLSGVLEMIKSMLHSTLRTVLRNDLTALTFLATAKLASMKHTHTSMAALVADRTTILSLGPHPLVLRVANELAELELLNAAPFSGSSFGEVGLRAHVSFVGQHVGDALVRLFDVVLMLAQRHASPVARGLMLVTNVFAVMELWNRLGATHAATAMASITSATPTAPASLPSASATSMVAFGVAYMHEAIALPAHVELMEHRLNDAISSWIRSMARGSVMEAVATLAEQVSSAETSSSSSLDATHVQQVMSTFNEKWSVELPPMVQDATRLLKMAMNMDDRGASSSPTPADGAPRDMNVCRIVGRCWAASLQAEVGSIAAFVESHPELNINAPIVAANVVAQVLEEMQR